MSYAFEPAPRIVIAIEHSHDLFPVRRLWCVGRNYAEHAREMGHDASREPPFFFAKAPETIVAGGGALDFPGQSDDVQHEVELAVALHGGGRDLSMGEAAACIFGYALACDLTRRDIQAEAKRLSRPWEMAKSFDESCPIGAIRRRGGDQPVSGAIELLVDGQIRQSGVLDDMIWPVADCIAILSRFVTLAAGDIVLTGTPAGVGRLLPGNSVVTRCALAPDLSFHYRKRLPAGRQLA